MNGYPKKRWGQNFMIDPNMLRKIARTIAPQPGDSICEIGPGKGALTAYLLQSGATVHAIEIDAALLSALREKLGSHPDLHLYQADALQFDYSALAKIKKIRLTGNIPYNITSSLLFKIFAMHAKIKDAYFVVQKELAQRVVATPGHKDYGILSVVCQFYGPTQKHFDISPQVFRPIPRVTSSLISLEINPLIKELKEPETEKFFIKVVKTAFNQRRKTLRNSLHALLPANTTESPIDLSRRPESLTVSEFLQLSTWLKGCS